MLIHSRKLNHLTSQILFLIVYLKLKLLTWVQRVLLLQGIMRMRMILILLLKNIPNWSDVLLQHSHTAFTGLHRKPITDIRVEEESRVIAKQSKEPSSYCLISGLIKEFGLKVLTPEIKAEGHLCVCVCVCKVPA